MMRDVVSMGIGGVLAISLVGWVNPIIGIDKNPQIENAPIVRVSNGGCWYPYCYGGGGGGAGAIKTNMTTTMSTTASNEQVIDGFLVKGKAKFQKGQKDFYVRSYQPDGKYKDWLLPRELVKGGQVNPSDRCKNVTFTIKSGVELDEDDTREPPATLVLGSGTETNCDKNNS